ncbi:MAG TPA: molybdate ABC transporter substrate-binding protein [Steroidobacteraceae bacterium]|nr:molybdate ABC transporter substrate-binding protein [Steroidobacteraceae bacterium]
MNTTRRSFAIFQLWLLALFAVSPSHAEDLSSKPLTVYAAASLTNALDEIGRGYTEQSGQQVKFSYGASSTLARQIEAGATADVFFSADNDWMDYLESHNLINKASRKAMLGNTLVLIAPADSAIKLKISPHFALAATLGQNKLSTGDPDSVPVGMYARAALTTLGVWNEVADKLVRADNVRTALTFVDHAEAALGIVYETDAMVDSKVRIVDRFPADTHPPIVYPAALTSNATAGAEKFIAYLNSADAQAIFKKYGFKTLR